LSGRMEMAVQVRLGEKWVLREAIQEANSFAGSNKRMRLSQTLGHDLVMQNGKAKRRAEDASNPRKKGRFT
jgi:SET domain-containing protein 6